MQNPDPPPPRTHVKVQFGQNAYWVEYGPTPHPYGEVLTELRNCGVVPYVHTLSVLEQAVEEKNTQAAPRAFLDAVRGLSFLPYFRLLLSDLRQFNDSPMEHFVVGEARIAFESYILSAGKKDLLICGNRPALSFDPGEVLTVFNGNVPADAFEKKKGQRRLPLAQQIYENCLDAFVSGVSLGKPPEVYTPQVNNQYAVFELGDGGHELVEKCFLTTAKTGARGTVKYKTVK